MPDPSEWLPEVEAPSGKWLLVRARNRETDAFWTPVEAVKLGGMWWTADCNCRKLVPFRSHSHTIPATDPNWMDRFSPWVPVIPEGGPQDVYVSMPDEWCDIPDDVAARLLNRMPVPGIAA